MEGLRGNQQKYKEMFSNGAPINVSSWHTYENLNPKPYVCKKYVMGRPAASCPSEE